MGYTVLIRHGHGHGHGRIRIINAFHFLPRTTFIFIKTNNIYSSNLNKYYIIYTLFISYLWTIIQISCSLHLKVARTLEYYTVIPLAVAGTYLLTSWTCRCTKFQGENVNLIQIPHSEWRHTSSVKMCIYSIRHLIEITYHISRTICSIYSNIPNREIEIVSPDRDS